MHIRRPSSQCCRAVIKTMGLVAEGAHIAILMAGRNGLFNKQRLLGQGHFWGLTFVFEETHLSNQC